MITRAPPLLHQYFRKATLILHTSVTIFSPVKCESVIVNMKILNSKRKLQKWLSESINVKIEELLKVLVTGAGSVPLPRAATPRRLH